MFDIRYIFTLVLIFILIVGTILMLYYKIDDKTIKEDEALAEKYADPKMNALLNGSGINNIPNLNIITTNSDIETANKCAAGPVKVQNNYISDAACQKLCLTSNASALIVNSGDHIAYNNSELVEGAYCLLGERPECDLTTTYAVMTLNSVVCYSKVPELFGGTLGKTVVACNDLKHYDADNYLYDGLNQRRVYNSENIYFTADGANEKLPDGSYRFTCVFEGEDDRGNLYQEHPLNRFHPIKNECASLIYRAHPDVKTKWNENGTRICDCGDFQETRVGNMDPDDPSSLCSSIISKLEKVDKEQMLLTKPYPCFTMFSPAVNIGSMHPCPPEQFTRQGNMIGKLELTVSTNTNTFLSYGDYKSLSDGFCIYRDL